MNITVLGLWHLGCVTAACCAKHFNVVGLDFSDKRVRELSSVKAPLFEPGLDDLLRQGLEAGRLNFTTAAPDAARNCDLLWICHDTPVNENDESDTAYVLGEVRRVLPLLNPGTIVIVSSQLPVGTCAELEREFPKLLFCCSPENLRLGKALEVFQEADRVIVGLREGPHRETLEQLFKPFTERIIFMRTESAEMVKHALNSFLALSVAYINEVARVCERMGADGAEVASGLKTDFRIGPRAYLSPGGPFAGGTLARDVVTLTRLGTELQEQLILIPAIKTSNDQHRGWNLSRLQSAFSSLAGKTITVLGLAYKPGTNTLRRSSAIELCVALVHEGAVVRGADPAVTTLPAETSVTLFSDAAEAVKGSDAVVVCTEWPVFKDLDWSSIIPTMRRRLVVDANGFLRERIGNSPGLEYISVGGSRPKES